jgi:cell division septal protein FtsQ
MGKKKSRKKNSGGGFASIGKLISQSFRLLVRSVPMLVVILAGGAFFMGVRSALYADYNLTVQKVTVDPPQSLSAAQRERLEAQVFNKNILNADLQALAETLEKDASIQNAKVTRRLPGEIYVEVQKRKALAFIRLGAAANYGVVSEDGMILDVVAPAAATGLIVEVQGAGLKAPAIGQKLNHRGFIDAVQFLNAYQATALAAQEPVTKIILDHLGNVSVILKEGPEVRLGRRPSQRVEAMKKVAPLLEGEMRKKISYIDLQYDDVVVKQKGSK